MSEPRFVVRPFDRDAWDRMVAPFHGLALPQCWAYGAARAARGGWRVERGVVERSGDTIGAAQVMVRALPAVGGGLAWVGRGPLWRLDGADSDGWDTLADVLSALRRHYVDEHGLYLRVAPPVTPGPAAERAFAASGFRATDVLGWASAIVDLRQPGESLRAALAQKWRNSLNKAERLGLSVVRVEDGPPFDAFLNEYRAFIGQRGFSTTVTPELLAALQDSLPAARKLVAYRASHRATPLGSVLIARCGLSAEYLAGTVLDAGRAFNVGQLLLWQAITDMKADGFSWFDVGGMDPALTPRGIYDFKRGLGGTPYRYSNELEADDGGMRARLVRWRVTRARSGAMAKADT